MAITYAEDVRGLDPARVHALYRAVRWSCADALDDLCAALRGSHALVTAWDGEALVGLGNAISDGALVVYYPHLLVHPHYQRRGIGRELVRRLTSRYRSFHQQVLVADGGAIPFYERAGFERAGRNAAMWIYPAEEEE